MRSQLARRAVRRLYGGFRWERSVSHCVRPTTDTHRSVAVAQGRPHTMPSPLVFVGGGAALTAAARAADKANGGGGPFRRLGEGRGAALREAWPAEALHTVPAARRAAAGDCDSTALQVLQVVRPSETGILFHRLTV